MHDLKPMLSVPDFVAYSFGEKLIFRQQINIHCESGSVADFVSRLWRKIDSSQKLRDKIWN